MDKNKITILILVDWFAPGYKAGGPIQSCLNVAFALKDHYIVKVLTTDTDYGSSSPYPEIKSNTWINNLDPLIQVFYANKRSLSMKDVKKLLHNTHAEYIYLNHLFSVLFVIYPLWLKWTGAVSSRIVLCPRGALYDSALSIKKYKKLPFLKLFKWMRIHELVRFHATNERERKAILSYFPGSEVVIADNLPNTHQPAFLDIEKKPGELKCIFIARIHPIKNLFFLLSVLKEVRSEVELTIVGPVEDENYWIKCKLFSEELSGNISITYKGAVPNHEIHSVLQEHHLFVLPTTGENFGHSIFEAFLSGRPVLISDQTPWHKLDEIMIGWDLPLKDKAAYVETIEMVAAMDQQGFTRKARFAWEYACNFINNPVLKQQYFQLFS